MSGVACDDRGKPGAFRNSVQNHSEKPGSHKCVGEGAMSMYHEQSSEKEAT